MQQLSACTIDRPPPECASRPALDTSSADARRLRQDLRQAVRDGAFVLGFQSRRSLRDDQLCGAEAQLRWPRRGRGMVQSNVFMPLALECGLTDDLVAWSLNAACQAALTWPSGSVSITIPAAAARTGRLLTLVGDALHMTGLDPERLDIALVDNSVSCDCADTLLSLSALRDLGVSVALDEFGRAGACLLKLRRLPLTSVKLDRSLTRDMLVDQAASAMVRAIVAYAHSLDVLVVATGVETDLQRTTLQLAGCDMVLERSAGFSREPDEALAGADAALRLAFGGSEGAPTYLA
jgi:EAL domain-containing protein (putative c-di-GMP-specific phosphodiesterase class I)